MHPIRRTGFALAAVLAPWLAGDGHAQAALRPWPATPWEAVDDTFGELPEGRTWGATSAIDVSADGRTVWVADRCGRGTCIGTTDIDPVMQFDLDGRLLESFGRGRFAWPHGLHVDAQGNVWVADATGGDQMREQPAGKGHAVYKFSPRGELLMTLGTPGVRGSGPYHFDRPCDVLVAPNGDVFVADGHGNVGNNRIVKFSSDGRFLKEWGSTGAEAGQFREPHALAMDSQGRLFVGDRGNHRIQIFDQEGNHLASWTQFGSPSGMFIDGDDVLYVADSDSNAERNPGWRRGIYVGSARDGWVTGFIPDPEQNPDNLITSGAEGVAVDATRAIYGAEVGPRRVRKYREK